MTLFHVDELIASLIGKLGGTNVMIDEAFQIIVIEKWVRSVDAHARIENRIVNGNQGLAVAVAARMRQLQADEQIVIVANVLSMCLSADIVHPRKAGQSLVVNEQLARVRSPFVEDGRRLAPDEFRAAAAEPFIAAEDEFIGMSVRRAVAAFHGLHAERIADADGPHLHGSKKGGEISGKTQVQAESLCLGFDFAHRMELEIMCHVIICAGLRRI